MTVRPLFLVAVLSVLAPLAAQEPKTAGVEAGGASFTYRYSDETGKPGPAPLLVVLTDGAVSAWSQWQPLAASRGWLLVAVPVAAGNLPWTDRGVRVLETVVKDFSRRAAVDAGRIYLAGASELAAGVFYAVSRVPDLWAAALAVGGNPRAAIETNRLFGANTQAAPLLWLPAPADRAALAQVRQRITAAGFNVEERSVAETSQQQALDWLAGHSRDAAPRKVDCETGNPAFGRCYWLEITRIDGARRNDAILSTRVDPGSGASLSLGGFGFRTSTPGPGLLVEWLPENYKGPLKPGDRILSVGGKEIADARAYVELMEQERVPRPVAVLIQRGNDRTRIETRVVLPAREEVLTGRAQAEYLVEEREIQIVSRFVAEVRVRVPAAWAPCRITWNGLEMAKVEKPGCWLLTEGKEHGAVSCGE